MQAQNEQDNLIRRVADYERISGIFWIVLGVIQVCMVFTAIAGIWNIFAGVSRRNAAKRIRDRDPNIPAEFDGIAQLVIIGLINLMLGGVIGVLFIAFDFYIRDLVLTNAHLFSGVAKRSLDSTAASGLQRSMGPGDDYIEQIKKLAELRESGLLTSDEFEQKKRELLGATG